MSNFTVAPRLDNSRIRRIGYQVISSTDVGGGRVHALKQAKPVMVSEADNDALAAAKIEMQAEADRLNIEAAANRARAAEAHQKFLASRAAKGM